MKTNYLFLFSLALMVSMLFACNSENSSQKEADSEEMTEEAATDQSEDMSKDMTSQTALIISHEVEDFDAWKVKFDEHASAREEAQMQDWAMLTGRENPNMVTVIFKVGDVDAAKAFTSSEDLKTAMKGAGVLGQPNMRFANVGAIDQEAAGGSDFRLYVQHKVADFDAWKAVFDSKADMHSEAGISPVTIARGLDDPNDVTVVLAAADFETIDNFLNNAELKAAMEEAGVQGEPVFNFMNIVSLNK